MSKKTGFISLPRAAEKCGVDRRTMWRWVKSNKVNAFVTPGGHHRVLRSEIDKILHAKGPLKKDFERKKTILVIDDDASVCEILKKRLSEENYHVETASDGFIAGLKARDLKPNLIILDPMIAGLDEIELCRTIKANGQLKNCKIISLVRHAVPQNKNSAKKGCPDEYLKKNIDLRILIKKINALFKTHGQKHFNELSTNDV